jgi:glycolate oxidase
MRPPDSAATGLPGARSRQREPLRRGYDVDEILRLALRLEGSITGEHGVGVIKRGWLATELGEVSLDVHRSIKRALDPDNRMNPGKVLPDEPYAEVPSG